MISALVGAARNLKNVTVNNMENIAENISENKKQVFIAIGAVRNSEGKILLQKRLDPLFPEAHEKWEFPGGRIEFGERPEETVKREFREETGCEVLVKKILPLVQSTVWTRSDKGEQQGIICCYEAELIQGTPQALDRKVAEVGWFTKEETKNLEILRGVKEFIELLD